MFDAIVVQIKPTCKEAGYVVANSGQGLGYPIDKYHHESIQSVERTFRDGRSRTPRAFCTCDFAIIETRWQGAWRWLALSGFPEISTCISKYFHRECDHSTLRVCACVSVHAFRVPICYCDRNPTRTIRHGRLLKGGLGLCLVQASIVASDGMEGTRKFSGPWLHDIL